MDTEADTLWTTQIQYFQSKLLFYALEPADGRVLSTISEGNSLRLPACHKLLSLT